MAVSCVQFHWKGALDQNIIPILNGGKPALLFSFVFLLIAAQGPGKWALSNK